MAFHHLRGPFQNRRQEAEEEDKQPSQQQALPGVGGVSSKDDKRNQDGNEAHYRPVRARGKGGDKQGNHQADEPQPPAGEALPVQHENKARIHQGAARLTFGHDDQHGEHDDKGCQHEVFEAAQAEVLLAEHEG